MRVNRTAMGVSMNEIILKIINEEMKSCESYNSNFCDYRMCLECFFSNELLRHEYCKINNICPICHGTCMQNSFFAELFSFTSTCNICGGSGKYINYNL
jgi:DnaJ-class molecular chaperone